MKEYKTKMLFHKRKIFDLFHQQIIIVKNMFGSDEDSIFLIPSGHDSKKKFSFKWINICLNF